MKPTRESKPPQDINHQEPTEMERVNSRDTFTTLIEEEQRQDDTTPHDTSDLVSLISSQETLFNPTIKIMNQSITNYTHIYTLPLISNFLHTGVQLYRTWDDVISNTPPLLSRSPTKLTLFKKTPLMVIHRHARDGAKHEFCRVEFKIHSIHITYYVLRFTGLGTTVYLINNNSAKPTVDFAYSDTDFRIVGITGTTSALGTSPEIKLYVMRRGSENLLTHGCVVEDDARGKLRIENKLSRLINGQEQGRINLVVRDEKPVVDIPLARYLDQGDVKVKVDNVRQKHIVKHGVIKMYDWLDGEEEEEEEEGREVSDDMLVICCVLLVLREQEYRKFKGG
ncbi:hypothetical protein Cantr_06830 [Candida viswanathii]|uniref:Uncharacterized protein n=1 Tax=Candida viswanathii TaxID=5486 RepID=A0A367XX78_9ASCO|nr:hypothetical protein Cantr_06830 [Candida viswanathii]